MLVIPNICAELYAGVNTLALAQPRQCAKFAFRYIEIEIDRIAHVGLIFRYDDIFTISGGINDEGFASIRLRDKDVASINHLAEGLPRINFGRDTHRNLVACVVGDIDIAGIAIVGLCWHKAEANVAALTTAQGRIGCRQNAELRIRCGHGKVSVTLAFVDQLETLGNLLVRLHGFRRQIE